ncbi:hypothetical protein E2C01_037177 [Portunus trituberculatus]|uniref:Uncharacterized protein n=1 Tax=Portunus trituberculatus TaxID=210409 RepID=A0A5B7FEW0_PORTR|nr:hypothetical protein [Portunus trituberculatus]
MCGEEKESVEHFLVECDKYIKQRKTLDTQVANIIGREDWEERKEGEDREIRTVLGLTGNKVKDYRIVSHMKIFLVESWSIRNQLCRR